MIFALRSLIFGLALMATLQATVPLPDLPPRIVAPNDQAEFRHLVLDNGLRVILVSDPSFNKSAASLVVGTGQIDDPFDMVGLAHFTEHMLFLGTEKYPDVSGYSAFITRNGGHNNAYTASDHTNYQFEIRHEAFPEALDRFAQFFIAPLFNPDFTTREVNAVHNEAMRHVQSDSRRILNVRRELYDPTSGESKFSTGNKDTLAQADADAVRAFYESHYSADRMALALTGSVSLNDLEKLAREIFSAIPRRDLPTITREPHFLPRKQALRLATVEPVKDIRQLSLEFVVPPTRPDFASKSDALLVALINYAGNGGLTQYLKDAGLATGVAAGIWERTPGYGSLFIDIALTPEGETANQRVMAAIFAYIQHLRNAPFPTEFFEDQARIAALTETYTDRGEGSGLATALANQALFFPLEIAERAPYVWGQPDDAAYRKLLDSLTPDNLLITLAAKGVPTDQQEKIYGTAYAYTESTGPNYRELLNPPAIPTFALPGINPYMPRSTRILSERPSKLIDEPGLQLYYAADVEFERPRTTLIFHFIPQREVADLKGDLLLNFYQTCLLDAIEPAANDAAIAGVSFDLSVDLEGMKLTVSGFGDSPAKFAQHLAGQFLTFQVSPQRFAALQERVIRSLRSYEQTEAYKLARDRATAIGREYYYLPNEQLDLAPAITFAEIKNYASRYFASGKIEALIHGHTTSDEAKEIARNFANHLGARPASEETLLRRRHLALTPGTHIIDTARIAGANSAYWALHFLPADTPQLRAATAVLSNILSDPFYTELRTHQQLGYIVGSGASISGRQLQQIFVIQSSEYSPDELRDRAETFLQTLPDLFTNMTDETFANFIAGVRSQIEEKPTSISEKAHRLFTLAYEYDGDWQRRTETLSALDRLTKTDVASLLNTIISPETTQQIIVLLSGTPHHPSQAESPISSRKNWKRTQDYR